MKHVYSIVATNHCSERAQALIKAIKPGTVLTLVREPENKFDKNAVAVHVDGEKIGYVPKGKNVALAAFIDASGTPAILNGEPVEAARAIMGMDNKMIHAKILTGKFAPSPNSAFPQVEIEQ